MPGALRQLVVGSGRRTESRVPSGTALRTRVPSGTALRTTVRSAGSGVRVSYALERRCLVMRLHTLHLGLGAQRRKHGGVLVGCSSRRGPARSGPDSVPSLTP